MKKSINTNSAQNLKGLGRIFTAITFLLLAGSVFSQTISIQGVLRDPNGRSVEDGSYSVVFQIYDVNTGGASLWSDTYTSLKTKHGVFQANLGENTALDGLAFDTTYYVGVTVEAFAEMTPRIALTVYPYAKAILGQDNKFPSTGNIVLAKDSIIVKLGALKFEGADGRIVFNDGTSLNTANFSGPASAILNPSSININADNDGNGSGAINLQVNGTNAATISNNGDALFENAVFVSDSVRIGALSASNLILNDTSILARKIGSSSTLYLNYGSGFVATSDLLVGKNDSIAGKIDLYGGDIGSTQGGRINFFKAADHDGDGSGTASEFWYMEAINDDLRIGNIFANNDIMTFRQDGNIGIGASANNPAIDLAIGDHDTGIDWISEGKFSLKQNNFSALTINGNGFIGIGSGALDAQVDLAIGDDDTGIDWISEGKFSLKQNNYSALTVNGNGNIGLGSGALDAQFELAIGDDDTGIDWAGDGKFYLMSNGSSSLTINDNGNVGIGSTSPTEAKLVVNGSVNRDWLETHYWNSSGYLTGDIPSQFYSISAANYIASGGGYVVHSDARIKEIVGRSSSSEDLEQLKKLQITDYTHIDKASHGSKQEKKLIAQEVAAVYAGAVNMKTGFIPNIYKPAVSTSFESGELMLKLKEAHNLKVGDKIKIYVDDHELIEEVLAVTDKTFTINAGKATEKAFVYGIEVDDFHTVDYDAISMLNVSATQELAKQVEALQKENEALKKKLAGMSGLEARLESIEALLTPARGSQLGKQ